MKYNLNNLSAEQVETLATSDSDERIEFDGIDNPRSILLYEMFQRIRLLKSAERDYEHLLSEVRHCAQEMTRRRAAIQSIKDGVQALTEWDG